LNSRNILVVAIHPDDEVLGAGGSLLKHKAAGDRIHWLIVTQALPEDFGQDYVQKRSNEIKAVANMFDFDSVHQLGLAAGKVDTLPMGELISKFGKVFKEVQPDTVYLPFAHDVHSDHRVSFDAAWSCCKPFRYPFVKRVLMMETPSETDQACPVQSSQFVANVYKDVSDHFARKLEIMRIYQSEMGEHPFPRSAVNLEAWATMRGASVGVQYAEAFMLLRDLS